MANSISKVHHLHAANENTHEPNWINEVPDDWSHTVLVTSDQPVLNRRNSENDELQGSEAENLKAA